METTIDELVKNLITENGLSDAESIKLEDALNSASRDLKGKNRDDFVNTVRKGINASNRKIFVNNTINVNELRKIVDDAAKDAKEKQEIKDAQMNEVLDSYIISGEKEFILDDTDMDFKVDFKFLENMFNGMPVELKMELAEEIENSKKYFNLVDGYMEKGATYDDAMKKAAEEMNLTDAEVKKFGAFITFSDGMEIKKLRMQGLSGEESLNKFFLSPSRAVRYSEEEKQIMVQEAEEYDKNLQVKDSNYDSLTLMIADFFKKREKDPVQMHLTEIAEINDFLLNLPKGARSNERLINERLEKIANLEKGMRHLKRAGESKEIIQKRETILKGALDKYLSSDEPVEDILIQIQKEHIDINISIEDLLDVMVRNSPPRIYNDSTGMSLRTDEYNLIKNKRKMQAMVTARDNAIEDGNQEEQVRLDDLIKKLQLRIDEKNNNILNKRNYIKRARDIDNDKSNLGKFVSVEEATYVNAEKVVSLDDAVKSRDQVLNDNRELKAIMKNTDISMVDAAKKYFKEDPAKLDTYTEEEKDIILGREKAKKPQLFGGIKAFWKKMFSSRNKVVIEKASEEKLTMEDELQGVIESEVDGQKIIEALKKKRKIDRTLKDAKKIDDSLNKEQSIESILAKRERDALLAKVTDRYIQSDMSIAEVLREMKKEDPKIDLDFEDVFPKIAETMGEFTNQNNIATIKSQERQISNLYLVGDAFEIAIANAEKQGRTDLIPAHETTLKNIDKKVDTKKETIRGIKASVREKLGIYEKQSEEEPEKISQDAISGLTVETIDTGDEVVLNTAEIVAASGITMDDVNAVFAEISNIPQQKNKIQTNGNKVPAKDDVETEEFVQ